MTNLIQIPVTLAIIGSVATLTLSNAHDVINEARHVRRSADAYQTTLALGIYFDDNLTYPVYTGNNPEESWSVLTSELVPNYIQGLPVDPDTDGDNTYRYWSDGKKAKVIYGNGKERWSY